MIALVYTYVLRIRVTYDVITTLMVYEITSSFKKRFYESAITKLLVLKKSLHYPFLQYW